jgi:hypothetical protein
LPETRWLGDWCVADYMDVFYYTLGALVAAVFWRWWYGSAVESEQSGTG